jgi:hypothetical protein
LRGRAAQGFPTRIRFAYDPGGLDAADVATLLVSLLALGTAGWSLRLSRETERRDERRFEREEEAALTAQRALLRARFVEMRPDSEEARYKFAIRNTGQHDATGITAWFVGTDGNPASTTSYSRQTLLPGESMELVVVGPAHHDRPLNLYLKWRDGREGDQGRVSDAEIPSGTPF